MLGCDTAMISHVESELQTAHITVQKMLKRGIRVLPFGDYGFAFNPHGADARELEHMVNLLGFKPIETLVAATKWGGEAFAMGGSVEIGEIRWLSSIRSLYNLSCPKVICREERLGWEGVVMCLTSSAPGLLR